MILSLIIPIAMLVLARRWSAQVRAEVSRPPGPLSHVTKIPRDG